MRRKFFQDLKKITVFFLVALIVFGSLPIQAMLTELAPAAEEVELLEYEVEDDETSDEASQEYVSQEPDLEVGGDRDVADEVQNTPGDDLITEDEDDLEDESFVDIMPFPEDDDTLRAFWLGNDENPHLQLNPANTGWQGHTLRVFFRASTPGEVRVYGPGEIEIRIPSYLMERRDGSPHGEFDEPSMQMPNSAAADVGGLGFHFVVEDGYIILRNHRDVTTTEPFQFDIPFRYRPSNIADGFRADIPIIVEYFGDRAREERNDDLTLEFNNRLTPTPAQKLLRGTPYGFWQSVWGTPPPSPENYFFVVYDINIGHAATTTQPFHGRLIERPQNDGEVVAWSIARNARDLAVPITAWTRGNTAQFNANNALTSWSRAGISVGIGGTADINSETATSRSRWSSVIVAYPRTGEQDQEVTNCIQWTVRGIDAGPTMDQLLTMDNLDEIDHTHRDDVCVTTVINDLGFDVRGDFGISKVVGGSWPILPLFDSESGRHTFNIGDGGGRIWITSGAYTETNGGTEPFRTQVIDDYLYIYAGGIFHELNPEDYRFTAVRISNLAEYVPIHINNEIVGTDRLPNASRSPMQLYYMPLGSTEWVHFNTFTPTANLDSGIFNLPTGSHAHRIMAIHDNGRYWVEFDLEFGFELIATEHVREIVAEHQSVQVHNFANLQVFRYDDPEHLYDIIEVSTDAWSGSLADILRARDQATYGRYVLRSGHHLTLGRPTLSNASHKHTTNAVTDAANGRQVITYNLEARTWVTGVPSGAWTRIGQVNTAVLRELEVEIREGVFFDLLPMGSILNPDSIVARDMLGIIPHRLYTHENYRGSGQTLIEIHVESTAEFNSALLPALPPQPNSLGYRTGTGFRVQFDVFYPWESIVDHGNNLRNVAAFQARDGAMMGAAVSGVSFTNIPAWADDASNHGSFVAREQELMSNLAPGATPDGERNTVYMQNNTTVPVNVATNAGFSKMIRAAGDAQYSMHTSTFPGETYHYRLRFQNFDLSYTTNLIIFDVLETAHDGLVPYWYGVFESVDLTQPIMRGIAPVVYFSTLESTDPVGNPALYADLSNTAVWTTVEPEDRSTITAVAIDLTYDTNGNLFVIAPSSSIVVNIHMRAPVDQVDGPLAHNRASFSATLNPVGGGPGDHRSPAYSLVTTIDLPDPDIRIRKTSIPVTGTEAAPREVAFGGSINYLIEVSSNEDRLNVRYIDVEDTIPAHLIFDPSEILGFFGNNPLLATPISEHTRISYTTTGQTINWTINSLTPGETFTLVVPTRVDPTLTERTEFVNQAFITAVNGREGEVGSEITYHVAYPQTLTKSADRAAVNIHGEILYTLRVNHSGNVTLEDFLVVDYLEADLIRLIRGSVQVDGEDVDYNFDPVTGRLEVELEELAPGDTDITFVVVALPEAEEAEEIPNTAYLYGPELGGERLQIDEDDDLVLVNESPTLTKEVNRDRTIIGGELIYTLTISNPLEEDLENFLVVDTLRTDLVSLVRGSFQVDGEDASYTFNATTGRLSVELDVLTPGDTVITFRVIVLEAAEAYGEIPNVAYLYGEADQTYGRPVISDGNVSVDILEPPTLTKAVDEDITQVGNQLIYTLGVNNPNEEDLEDFLVIDYLATDLVRLVRGSVEVDGALIPYSFDPVTGQLAVELDVLTPGDTVITFRVVVLPSAEDAGEIPNTAHLYGPPVLNPTLTDPDNYERFQVDEDDELVLVLEQPTLEKIADRGVASVHGEINYTLRVTNPNSENLENMIVVDHLEIELVRLVRGSVEIDGEAVSYEFDPLTGMLRVELLELEPGNTDITFRVILLEAAETAGVIPNTAHLYGPEVPSETDPNVYERFSLAAHNNQVTVLELPTLEKIADREVASVHGEINYTLRVNNPNEESLEDFVVIDQLRIDLVRLVRGSVQVNGEDVDYDLNLSTGVLTVELATLEPGNTDITFRVIVLEAAEYVGEIPNTAHLYAPYMPSEDDPNVYVRPEIDEDDAEVITLMQPTLEKIADREAVNVHGQIVYTLRINNPNEEVLENFLVVDHLEMDLVRLVRGSVRINGQAVGYDFNPETGRLAVEIENLPAGDTDVTFRVVVLLSATEVDEIPNTAHLYAPYMPSEDDPNVYERPQIETDNESAIVSEQATLSKIVNEARVLVGGELIYTLTVSNPLEVDLEDLVVVDTLQTDLVRLVRGSVQIDGEPIDYDFDPVTGELTVELEIVRPGNTAIVFSVIVLSEAHGGEIPNTAHLYGPAIPSVEDPSVYERPRIDEDDELVDVLENPTLEKIVDTNLVQIGDVLTYTLRVTNPNDIAINDFVVIDHLRTDLVHLVRGSVRVNDEFVEYTFTSITRQLVVDLETLEPGETEIMFSVIVLPAAAGEDIPNTAHLYGPPTPSEDDPNVYERPVIDVDDELVEVLENPTLTKSVDHEEAEVGDVLTYTLRVSNPNDEYLRDFLVVDELRVDLVELVPNSILINGDPAAYVFEARTGRLEVLLPVLAPGDTDITFEVIVLAAAYGRDIPNTAHLYGPPIPTPEDPDQAVRPEVDIDDVIVVIPEIYIPAQPENDEDASNVLPQTGVIAASLTLAGIIVAGTGSIIAYTEKKKRSKWRG